jgi:hypothetical protein
MDVDGCAVAALFFLGGMMMKMMKKLRRRSLDQVRTTSIPLPGVPKMSAFDTYGISRDPFTVRQGERYAQRAEPMIDVGRFLPRFGPLISIKPYSYLDLLSMFLSPGSRSTHDEQCVQRAATHAEWAGKILLVAVALGLLLYAQRGFHSGKMYIH